VNGSALNLSKSKKNLVPIMTYQCHTGNFSLFSISNTESCFVSTPVYDFFWSNFHPENGVGDS
jgi:hypothetical protein